MDGIRTAGLASALLACSMIAGMLVVMPADAAETVYIRADGSIDPVTAPISTADDIVYTLTADMTDPIVIERDGIVLDGAGHTLRGGGYGSGVSLVDVADVTVTGMDVSGFGYGIYVYDSMGTTITMNAVHDNYDDGVFVMASSGAEVSDNELTENGRSGLKMDLTSDSPVSGNLATGNSRGGFTIITSSAILISGNNASGNDYEGFLVEGSAITLTDNIALDNGCGFTVQYCSDLTASGNFVRSPSAVGFAVTYSSGLMFDGNHITGCKMGFEMELSSNATMRDNSIEDCEYGLGVNGDPFWTFMHDIDTSNTVDGGPVYYLVSEEDMVIGPEDAPEIGYLGLVNCTRVTVDGLDLRGNKQGAQVAHSSNCTLTNNTVTLNMCGVEVFGSRNITLSRNNVTMNWMDGIHVTSSPGCEFLSNDVTGMSTCVYVLGSEECVFRDNRISWGEKGISVESSPYFVIEGNRITENGHGMFIRSSPYGTVLENRIDNNGNGIRAYFLTELLVYHNDFMANGYHVSKEPIGDASITLDNGYPSGGNFYSDYEGIDLESGPAQDQPGSDGIGDWPHVIELGLFQDDYPLMAPYNPYVYPVANFTYEVIRFGPVAENETLVIFNASYSADPENPGKVLAFRWDWDGDGEWDTGWDSDGSADHAFTNNATYTVVLQVRNEDHMTGTCAKDLTISQAEDTDDDDQGDDEDPEDDDDTSPWGLSTGALLTVAAVSAAAVAAAAAFVLLRRRAS